MNAEETDRKYDELREIGNQYAELVERQRDQIIELRGRVANLRRLRALDADLMALRIKRDGRTPPKLGMFGAIRLWLRSFGVKEDVEEDGFDLRS